MWFLAPTLLLSGCFILKGLLRAFLGDDIEGLTGRTLLGFGS